MLNTNQIRKHKKRHKLMSVCFFCLQSTEEKVPLNYIGYKLVVFSICSPLRLLITVSPHTGSVLDLKGPSE